MTGARPARHVDRPERNRVAIIGAVLGPMAVAAALVPLRDRVANTSVALLLVLVAVGVVMVGRRLAGLVAAVSAAVSFDFFWTEPYEALAIRAADDIETAVLLLLVGAAITEIVAWGRRQQAAADREAGFRNGVLAAAEAVASGDSPSRVIDRVSGQLVPLLGLDRCRFDYGTGLDHPRLEHDGSVVWRHRTVDVDAEGFPSARPTELLVESGGRFRGRFLLTAGSAARPTRAERLVAVALADQVGAGLAGYEARQRP